MRGSLGTLVIISLFDAFGIRGTIGPNLSACRRVLSRPSDPGSLVRILSAKWRLTRSPHGMSASSPVTTRSNTSRRTKSSRKPWCRALGSLLPLSHGSLYAAPSTPSSLSALSAPMDFTVFWTLSAKLMRMKRLPLEHSPNPLHHHRPMLGASACQYQDQILTSEALITPNRN